MMTVRRRSHDASSANPIHIIRRLPQPPLRLDPRLPERDQPPERAFRQSLRGRLPVRIPRAVPRPARSGRRRRGMLRAIRRHQRQNPGTAGRRLSTVSIVARRNGAGRCDERACPGVFVAHHFRKTGGALSRRGGVLLSDLWSVQAGVYAREVRGALAVSALCYPSARVAASRVGRRVAEPGGSCCAKEYVDG